MFFFSVINGSNVVAFHTTQMFYKFILQIKMGIWIFYLICYFYMLFKYQLHLMWMVY
jgi:hypothetical protein